MNTTQLTHEQGNFLNNYNGGNKFINSLKAQYQRNATLSNRQVSYLGTFIKNAENNTHAKNSLEVENLPIPKNEHFNSGLFSLESLEESTLLESPKNETPLLSNIEETLQKLASQVVHDAMKLANDKANVILSRAEKLAATNSKVMHIRIGDTHPKKLTNEAHELLPKLIATCKLGFNPLLVGPKGCGKTTLAAQLAEALGLRFGHIGLTAGASETWLFGRQTSQGFQEAQFSNFYENGGVFLLDEIDAADANLMLALNTSLANGKFYNPILSKEIERHNDFICIAAANTFGLGGNAEYTGRNRLDGATLDRFPIFTLDYNEKLEKQLCDNEALFKKLVKARKELQEKNSIYTISTRQIERISRLIKAGFSEIDAINTMAASFPKGLAEEIGLFSSTKNSEEIPF